MLKVLYHPLTLILLATLAVWVGYRLLPSTRRQRRLSKAYDDYFSRSDASGGRPRVGSGADPARGQQDGARPQVPSSTINEKGGRTERHKPLED